MDCKNFRDGENYCEAGCSLAFTKCSPFCTYYSGSIKGFDSKFMTDIALASSSKGNQRKWLVDNYFVKEQFFYQGRFWQDNLVEVIASTIGDSFKEYAQIVKYKPCVIKDNRIITEGCYSENFCNDGEKFISFKRVLNLKHQGFDEYLDYKDKFKFILNFYNKMTTEDCTDYLCTMIILDYLVGNEDRHLNNFGFIENDGVLKKAPLFDFGLGLFEHDCKYEGEKFKECLKLMQCKPFSKDNQIITDWVLENYWQHDLPTSVDLSGCVIPSVNAATYLRNRFMHLGISLEGVD